MTQSEIAQKGVIHIHDREVGKQNPVYLVAEISANHHQVFDKAVELVKAAKWAGADAVKFQTYSADTLTIPCDKEYFRIGGGTLWDGRSLYELYQEAHTPWEWLPKLKDVARNEGLDFFSSAFDPSAVDFLETLGVPLHKIASFEIVDIPLIEKMAGTGKPLILSTGMATVDEIQDALNAARAAGAKEILLLKCTSAYPPRPEEIYLETIPDMERRFECPVGLSDHTLGNEVPIAAVSFGACLVEKHVTLSRSTPGPDSAFSLEPQEFKSMVDAIRIVEKAFGSPFYGASPHESKSQIFRRSLFAVEDIKQGAPFTLNNIRSIRPAHGLAPKFFKKILGRKALCDIERGTPLTWDHVGSV